MAFSPEEKQALLAVKGVGPTVLQRFEEVGVDSFAKLAKCEAKALAKLVADMLGSTCWAQSFRPPPPRSLATVEGAIALAQTATD